jgi:hypothetical protein
MESHAPGAVKESLAMHIEVRRGEYKEVEAKRKLYREEARCQIVADSSLRRGFAAPYLILVDGKWLAMAASITNTILGDSPSVA